MLSSETSTKSLHNKIKDMRNRAKQNSSNMDEVDSYKSKDILSTSVPSSSSNASASSSNEDESSSIKSSDKKIQNDSTSSNKTPHDSKRRNLDRADTNTDVNIDNTEDITLQVECKDEKTQKLSRRMSFSMKSKDKDTVTQGVNEKYKSVITKETKNQLMTVFSDKRKAKSFDENSISSPECMSSMLKKSKTLPTIKHRNSIVPTFLRGESRCRIAP